MKITSEQTANAANAYRTIRNLYVKGLDDNNAYTKDAAGKTQRVTFPKLNAGYSIADMFNLHEAALALINYEQLWAYRRRKSTREGRDRMACELLNEVRKPYKEESKRVARLYTLAKCLALSFDLISDSIVDDEDLYYWF